MRYLALLLMSFAVAADDLPADPFAEPVETKTTPYSHQFYLLGYYQHNDVNDGHRFNPGLTRFADDDTFGMLDWQLKADWQSNWQGRARSAFIWNEDKAEGRLLEGYLGWHSDDYAWQTKLGRIKTEWSNGYNWSLTNLLTPYRDRPYIDLDDPFQQQGWDMLSISYGNGEQRLGAFVLEDQYALKFSAQGNYDYSLIVHKQEGHDIDMAAALSTRIGDATTLRMEWSAQHRREQAMAPDNHSLYHKILLGGAYTNAAGFNFRLEYLHNQHGFDATQWRQLVSRGTSASTAVLDGNAQGNDYALLGETLGALKNGQLRRNYLYFMVTTAQSESLWQYRQSIQYNIDDGSQLHRLELLKSFDDYLTGRLQWQIFNGCDTCEYGLTPNKNNIRLVLKRVF